MKLPGKRFGPPPLRGPLPDGIKYKPLKVKKIKISKDFPRFSDGGLSNDKLIKKIRKNYA
jgi:hypothetical protein|tara:strand:+ start:18 stop:197 length:180 start_codon:yes stop_codon:yes gene_type:complete